MRAWLKIYCPICGKHSEKVIYYGLPHRLCNNENCNCLFGFWSGLTTLLPFNGVFMKYDGQYFPAMLRWLFGAEE